MRSLITFTLFCIFSTAACASDATPLSLDLLKRFQSANHDIEAFTKNYPELEDADLDLDTMIQDDGKGILELAQKFGAYEDLNRISKQHGFGSLSEYIKIMLRMTLGMTALEFSKQSDEDKAMLQNMDIDKVRQQLVDSGAPASMVDNQLQAMEKMLSSFRSIKAAADKTSPADLKFIQANLKAVENALE